MFNIFLTFRFPKATRVHANYAGALLAYDILQLTAVIYLCTGIANPFTSLLLAPVSVAASSLTKSWKWSLIILTLVALTFLAITHTPIQSINLPSLAPDGLPQVRNVKPVHMMGMLPALAYALILITVYSGRIAQESRELSNALSATEMVLAREQHLSALDGLAAAAAHELGTPLATIAVVANEMSDNIDNQQALQNDIALIKAQSERCRTILSHLNSMKTEGAYPFEIVPFDQLIEECVAPHRDFGIDIAINRVQVKSNPPMIHRNAGIEYGLGNLIENAVDFAETEVQININWNETRIKLEIIDDGAGFDPDILSKLGDPYTTTRPRPPEEGDASEPGGLGLGIFIAKTLLERTGATVAFLNTKNESNAGVIITWPTDHFAIPAS